LDFSIKNKREEQDKKKRDINNEDNCLKMDAFMTPNNKIYNAKYNKYIDHENNSGNSYNKNEAEKGSKVTANNRFS
jgi:hypothetical protein